MEIRIQETGAVVTENEFRAMHPNTSFPAVLTLDILADFGADPVLEAPAPAFDPATQTAERKKGNDAAELVEKDGRTWYQQAWAVRDLTADEIAARLPTIAQYTDAVQSYLDTKAMERHYDNIVSACSYAGAPNPFQAEGIAFVTWRGNVWAACYQIMAAVQNGERTPPTIAGLVSELPELVLP